MSNMHKISKEAFENASLYLSNSSDSYTTGFTPVRISVNGTDYETGYQKLKNAVRKVLGEPKPLRIVFTKDIMQIFNIKNEVIKTEAIPKFSYMQIGLIRTIGMLAGLPQYYYGLAIIIEVNSKQYYFLNAKYKVFDELKQLMKENNVNFEDPFVLTKMPEDLEKEYKYFETQFNTLASAAGYPQQLNTVSGNKSKLWI